MRESGFQDRFEIVNGPEDGAEFPIAARTFSIGADPDCEAQIRLDSSVRPVHARASVTAGGYRIRRMAEAPVYVDGKRAGTLRSRVVRPGGYVQVGQTMLCLECAPEGIMSRSQGAVMENDLIWIVRHGSRSLYRTLRRLILWPILLGWEVVGTKLGALAALFLLYMFWPWFHGWVDYLASWGWAWAKYFIMQAVRKVFNG